MYIQNAQKSAILCREQVNEKFFELKKGHIGIVDKAQETSSDSDMHNTVCLCSLSVPIHFVDGSYMCI